MLSGFIDSTVTNANNIKKMNIEGKNYIQKVKDDVIHELNKKNKKKWESYFILIFCKIFCFRMEKTLFYYIEYAIFLINIFGLL